MLRTAKRAAREQCEAWLFAFTWATIREPIRQKRDAIRSEGRSLVEKERQGKLSDDEAKHLSELRTSSEVYNQFLHKITPTALQAEMEHEARQHERAKREAFCQSGRDHHQENGKE